MNLSMHVSKAYFQIIVWLYMSRDATANPNGQTSQLHINKTISVVQSVLLTRVSQLPTSDLLLFTDFSTRRSLSQSQQLK